MLRLQPCFGAQEPMNHRQLWCGDKTAYPSCGRGVHKYLPLDLQGGRPEPQSLPWYGLVKGFALVPQKGAIEAGTDPAAVLVLMEGGQLVLFDLPDLQPVPLSLPLQELPDLTILRLACSPAEAGPGSLGLHAATMERIRVTCRPAVQSELPVPNTRHAAPCVC